MADLLNLKVNECSNVEKPNLRVIPLGNKNWEDWYI